MKFSYLKILILILSLNLITVIFANDSRFKKFDGSELKIFEDYNIDSYEIYKKKQTKYTKILIGIAKVKDIEYPGNHLKQVASDPICLSGGIGVKNGITRFDFMISNHFDHRVTHKISLTGSAAQEDVYRLFITNCMFNIYFDIIDFYDSKNYFGLGMGYNRIFAKIDDKEKNAQIKPTDRLGFKFYFGNHFEFVKNIYINLEYSYNYLGDLDLGHDINPLLVKSHNFLLGTVIFF